MNRVSHHSKEAAQNTVEPHAARRATRQAAADNTQKAILFQFPGLFSQRMSTPPAHPMQQYVQTTRGDDDVAQAV